MSHVSPRLIPLGRIVRLQVQREKIKNGEGPGERYTPTPHLTPVARLRLGPRGVQGVDATGEHVPDIHHRDHPRSRHRGINGISLLTTAHYAKMRKRFGDHLVDGIAGESMLVESDRLLALDDLTGGIVIGEGDGAVIVRDWSVAHPCAPFSRFATRFPDDARPDRRLTEALQFLDDGTRGFYGVLPADIDGAEVALGAPVFLLP